MRPGRPEDHAAFARMFLALGVEDPPPSAQVWEQELMSRTFFVDGPREPLAYAVTDVVGTAGVGFVVQLVVDAPARGQGLGRRVMGALAEHLRARGCQEWRLNVKRDNVPALALYTSLGMKPAREAWTLNVTRAQVEALPPAPEPLEVVPVREVDHAALEQAFGLTPGNLAWYARFPSHQLLRLIRPGALEASAPLGFVDVRAKMGFLYPLYAVSLGHARVLLEEGFRVVGESVPALHVVVTDDAPLKERLRAAGASVTLEMLELRGPLSVP